MDHHDHDHAPPASAAAHERGANFHHPHGHAHDFSAANEHHFDESAHKYDSERALELARRTGAALLKSHTFDEVHTTVLDYACGTGLISRELAPHAKRIVGVDISAGMVEQYNRRVADQGIPSDEMQAICTVLKGEPGELSGEKFDVVVCGAAYHHFHDISDTTRILASFLKPGGVLLVADLIKPDVISAEMFPSEVHHIVAHRGGFTEADIHGVFEGAGLTDFVWTKTFRAKHHQIQVDFFIAKGAKPL